MDDVILPGFVKAKAYFDRFVEVFSTFDGAHVAQLFAAPFVALDRDGSLTGLL